MRGDFKARQIPTQREEGRQILRQRHWCFAVVEKFVRRNPGENYKNTFGYIEKAVGLLDAPTVKTPYGFLQFVNSNWAGAKSFL